MNDLSMSHFINYCQHLTIFRNQTIAPWQSSVLMGRQFFFEKYFVETLGNENFKRLMRSTERICPTSSIIAYIQCWRCWFRKSRPQKCDRTQNSYPFPPPSKRREMPSNWLLCLEKLPIISSQKFQTVSFNEKINYSRTMI